MVQVADPLPLSLMPLTTLSPYQAAMQFQRRPSLEESVRFECMRLLEDDEVGWGRV